MSRGFVPAFFVLISLLLAPLGQAGQVSWLQSEKQVACEGLLRNVSPDGAAPGAVIASPSRGSPNYYYHWVRDAALTMDTVVRLYERTGDAAARSRYRQLLQSYVRFSRSNQQAVGTLGEPKFEVDGRPFAGPWPSPQNDGPALRASALARLAHVLLGEGEESYVRSRLYDSRIPTDSVIKADLEYVAHHWRESSVDLWEEVRGQHFYTRAVQRRALLDGAELADRLGDGGAAAFYREQAAAIEQELQRHWDSGRGYLVATLDIEGWDRGKSSNLDSAVILGVLHGSRAGDAFLDPTRDVFLATFAREREAFAATYAINGRATGVEGEPLQPAIGRYPEDTYDGYNVGSRGNPWVLATNGFAEFCYRVAASYQTRGQVRVTERGLPFFAALVPEVGLKAGDAFGADDPRFNALIAGLGRAGDGFLARTRLHSYPDGSLSEQMNRETGFMQGARDLTWSYASFVTALMARESL